MTYAKAGRFWTAVPSNPTPFSLFSSETTYERPTAAYIALRQIVGHAGFAPALRQIQRRYGGASITERELEAVFDRWLPEHSRARLSAFFAQWFDSGYAVGGGAHRPQITGPGLAGPGFYTDSVCSLTDQTPSR